MIERFVFRLVQWNAGPPEVHAVCKRCLCMASYNDVFGLFQWMQSHDCSKAKVENFTGVPERL